VGNPGSISAQKNGGERIAHPDRANLHPAVIVLAKGIFHAQIACRIANFGEDILNHSRVEDFHYSGFDLEL